MAGNMDESLKASAESPVPAVPSQEFLAVQQLIDADRSGDGSTVQRAVQTLTPDKQAEFLKWYSGLATTSFQRENKRNAMAQPMSVEGFRTAIQAVDWTDTKTIDSYFSKAIWIAPAMGVGADIFGPRSRVSLLSAYQTDGGWYKERPPNRDCRASICCATPNVERTRATLHLRFSSWNAQLSWHGPR